MNSTQESRVVLENSLRWANNILAEVLSNHAYRFPETRAKLAKAISLIEEAKWSVFEESEKA